MGSNSRDKTVIRRLTVRERARQRSHDRREDHKLQLDRYRAQLERWKMLADYARDMRSRIDTSAKILFVLSGGALTLSAGLFLRQDRPSIAPELLPVLKNGWSALGASMLLTIALLVTVLAIGSWHTKARSRALLDETLEPTNGRMDVWLDILLWVLGLGAALFCMAGIWSLIYVAKHMLAG